jgi:hypothetical protein
MVAMRQEAAAAAWCLRTSQERAQRAADKPAPLAGRPGTRTVVGPPEEGAAVV